MSTSLSNSPANHGAQSPLTLTLSVADSSYRIVLPHADADYLQKKLVADHAPFEQEMLEDIRHRVMLDGLVLDIGAGIGNCTLYLAAAASCHVEAFECDPELCAALRESIALNGFGERVRLHETQLGREDGMARIGESELQVRALHNIQFNRKVEAIRLGAGGMGTDVLEGASQLLQRDRPLIYVQCGTEANYRRVSAWMSARGYAYWDTFDATPTHLFIPVERLNVEQLQHLQAKAASKDSRSNQLLREVRERLTQAEKTEREARAALVGAQMRNRETQTQEREAHSALDMQARDPKRAVVDVVMPLALRDPARLPAAPAFLKNLRVAGIMDEFTHHSFAPECELLPLRLANWQADLESFEPDLVFIESAWRGAEGDWSLKISNPSEAVASLIDWAQERRVPTIFWSKEDPVHFDTFLHVARAVDYVFTTDIDCIARYKREVGHDRVYLLPFAAQPASHNPIERFPRANAFCFAGAYYLKYPERQRDFRGLLDAIKQLKPVEIFDRNFDKPHPHHEFPPEFRPYIKGNLPFDQIDKAYKGYRYGVNMNTIKQSQTMFARRVFELLASNTVVVSNFSRGMRLLFGDLVIASDASAEIHRRLGPLEDETTLRKFRLAGLRKVMSQHTYAQRLAYIAEKLGASAAPPASAVLCAVAFPENAQQARAVVSGWRRQSLDGTPLCLVGTAVPTDLLGDGVSLVATAAGLRSEPAYLRAKWVAPFTASDYHGPHYLFDLLQATGYCNATAIGKASYFRSTGDAGSSVELVDSHRAYRAAKALQARCSILNRERFEALGVVDSGSLETAIVTGDDLMAIDEFNYALGVTEDAAPAVRLQVDDLPNLRCGLDLHSELLAIAERITPALAAAGPKDDVDAMPGLSAEEMAAALPQSLGARMSDGVLVVPVRVPAGKPHAYVYLQRTFARAELNLEINSRVQLLCEHDGTAEVRTIFEYIDANGQKISHTMARAGQALSLAIPAACRSIRFGLRFVGRGELRVRRLLTADLREKPNVLLGTAKLLAVLKQYPDYGDLYKYGFVHSRLRAYRRQGVACDVFRLTNDETYCCREFENIDVTSGDSDLLDLALQRGSYQHVLVHLMDNTMWEVIQRHIDRVRVTVWLHGAEIQAWQRRAFEFEGMDSDETSRKKRLSEQRQEFWRKVLAAPHPNLHFVFVSKYLADEVATDLGIDLSSIRHSVIHNFIDPEVFPYARKSAKDRLRLLSIRPFVSRVYANDLTVKALQAIADEPWFDELQVTIVGDGELFEDITRPLAGMTNVTLMKRFLTQNEIAALHRRHGAFICPTRMDTQGVSRDEAMSSGLVPITTAVAAVPEFVADDCAFLAAAEDHEGLAAAIRELREDPQRFLAMSDAAARRVRSQSGFHRTIGRELTMLTMDTATTEPAAIDAANTTEPRLAPAAPVDRINEIYRGEIPSEEMTRTARDRIHWMCAQCEGETVLDVGCSQGIASILLAREGFLVTAIDTHPDSIAFARAEVLCESATVQRRLTLLEIDLESLPKERTFDTILLGEVIDHQARPDRMLAAAKLRLRQGGRLVISTPFGLQPHAEQKVSLFPADLAALAGRSGLCLISVEADGHHMRCVMLEREAAAVQPDTDQLLRLTQAAALESQQILFEELADRGEQLKQKSDGLRVTQRKLVETQMELDSALKTAKASATKLSLELKALRSQHEGAVESLKHAHAQELKTLRGQHESAVESLKRAHAQELQARLTPEAATQLQRRVAELDAALKAAWAEHQAQLQALHTEHRSRLQAAHSEQRTSLEAAQAEHAAGIDKLQAALKARLAKQEADHRVSLESLRAEQSAAALGFKHELQLAKDTSDRLKALLNDARATLKATRSKNAYRLGETLAIGMKSPANMAVLPGRLFTLWREVHAMRRARAQAGGSEDPIVAMRPLAVAAPPQLAVPATPPEPTAKAATPTAQPTPAKALKAQLLAKAAKAAAPTAQLTPVPLDPEELRELLKTGGAAAVKARIMHNRGRLDDDLLATQMLQAAKLADDASDADNDFALAQAALALSRSEKVLRGFFWAAQRSRRFDHACKAIRDLERLYGDRPKPEQVALLAKLRSSPAYQLSVLEFVVDRPAQAIEGVPGRICYILHNSLPYSSGGYGTRSQGVAGSLQAAGHELVVLTRPGFPLDIKPELVASDVAPEDVIDGVRYVRTLEPQRKGMSMLQYVVAAADALEEQLRMHRPQFVMAASNYVTALPALIAARRLGLPFIYEVRGLWEITRISRQQEFGDTAAFHVQSLLEAKVAQLADHVFTLTEAMREELVVRGVEAAKIDLLPNSCDPSRFVPRARDQDLAQRLGIPADVPVIGYVGTFVDYEGLEDLTQACAELKHRGSQFRLMLVGNENASGSDRGPITEQIVRIAEREGLSDWLIMPGRVPHEQVESYYSLIDIAPFPRKPWPVCEMVSPLKPLEALAMEKAVLVSDVRALAEMVRVGETGMHFRKGEIGSLADMLQKLLVDPELRLRLGQAGRRWVAAERTWRSVGSRVSAQLTRLVEPQAGPAQLGSKVDPDLLPPWWDLVDPAFRERCTYVDMRKWTLSPDVETLRRAYVARFDEAAVAKRMPAANWARADYCAGIADGAGSLLDIGSGLGEFVNLCQQRRPDRHITSVDTRNWDLWIDASGRLERVMGSLPALDDALARDTVTCFEVIEHLPPEHLADAVATLRRLARRRLFISVPFMESLPLHKGHLNRFDVDQLLLHFPDGRFTVLGKGGRADTVVAWILCELPGTGATADASVRD